MIPFPFLSVIFKPPQQFVTSHASAVCVSKIPRSAAMELEWERTIAVLFPFTAQSAPCSI